LIGINAPGRERARPALAPRANRGLKGVRRSRVSG
jgi:hypothetical protein